MHDDSPSVRATAMFPDVNPLPGSECQSAIRNGDAHVYSRQSCAHVSRHVVVSFSGMDEERVAIGHEPLKECLEIATHIRVGILLDHERGRRVLKVNCRETGADLTAGNQ